LGTGSVYFLIPKGGEILAQLGFIERATLKKAILT
jgi:hypothetical protein